jgi:hypothetical protein
MSQSSSSRKPVAAADTDAIPMKGVSPVWYGVAGGAVLLVLAIVVGIKLSDRNSEAAERTIAPPAQVEPRSNQAKMNAAEARQHLEITQRSLERLKEAEAEKQAQEAAQPAESEPQPAAAPAGAAPAARPDGTRTSAAAPAALPAKAPSKTQKKTLDALDSIGSDIASQLGK